MTVARLSAFAAFVALLTPAFAGADVHVPAFSAIEAHSGAGVILRHGPTQRVTIIKGDLKTSRIEVKGNSLDIEGCQTWGGCWGYKLEVEIVSPDIQALDAHGGGSIRAEGNFPQQKQLNLQAHGGGAIDARTIPAENVNAEAHGGGAIRLKALVSLSANAHGGGAITYTGDPKHVQTSANGGGAISHD
jgi:hypothetical protein